MVSFPSYLRRIAGLLYKSLAFQLGQWARYFVSRTKQGTRTGSAFGFERASQVPVARIASSRELHRRQWVSEHGDFTFSRPGSWPSSLGLTALFRFGKGWGVAGDSPVSLVLVKSGKQSSSSFFLGVVLACTLTLRPVSVPRWGLGLDCGKLI